MADAAWPITEAQTPRPAGAPPVGALSAESPSTAGKAGLGTRLLYGLGSMAFGVKDNGFQTILLIFYNQVVGLPAAMVGLAIMLALVIDAVMDPIVGQFSDNLRTPWGRRHPLMYASAIPLGLSYLLLWNPPHASQGVQFAYLLIVAIVVRTFISVYEAPSSALAPELTTDYAERTSLLGIRMLFAWFGGLLMYFLAFTVLLKPDATHKVGQLNPVGYAHYGLVAGALMTAVILISAFGTHHRIKTFTAPPRRKIGLLQTVKEMGESFANRSFLMLVMSSLFLAMATGVAFSMSVYFYTYVWALSAAQISLFAVVNLGAAALAVVLASRLSRRNKRAAAIGLILMGLCIASTPLALRILSVFPKNGAPLLYPLLLVFSLFGVSMMIASAIVGTSMIADVVEDSQLRTGRRSEGLFFAVNAFVQKAVSGLGIFTAGIMLSVVHFPAKASGIGGAAVDPQIIRHLVLIYLPTTFGLYVISALWLLGYRITRQGHEANLKQLAEAGNAAAVLPQA